MDRRQELILDVFADWAVNCRKEYSRRFENLENKNHIEQLRNTAKDEYEKIRTNRKHYGYASDIQGDFDKAAYKCFLYGLFEESGDGLYEGCSERLKRFDEKWLVVASSLRHAVNCSDALEMIYRSDSTFEYQIGRSLREDYGYKEGELTLDEFTQILTDMKNKEWEERFGERAVFEQAGRYYAGLLFEKMTRPKGRPSRKSNLDTVRAFQFNHIVENVNKSLQAENLEKTTVAEVSEMIFGETKITNSHRYAEDIDWVLSNYFYIKNSTVSAFLNSISRGKRALNNRE